MVILLKLLGCACITILFTTSEPTNRIKSWMGFDVPDGQGWKAFISRLVQCNMCSGFYIGLILTQNLYYAAIIAIMAEFINNKIY
jgi:hypothetical protein